MSVSDNWLENLGQYLESVREKPFSWGEHDCCTFASGAVMAQTGQDIYGPYRGKYKTQRGAASVIKRAGFDDVAGPFTAALGEPVGALLCGRGDIVYDGESVGVMWYAGGPVALFVGGEAMDASQHHVGLITRPVSVVKFGWKVAR